MNELENTEVDHTIGIFENMSRGSRTNAPISLLKICFGIIFTLTLACALSRATCGMWRVVGCMLSACVSLRKFIGVVEGV